MRTARILGIVIIVITALLTEAAFAAGPLGWAFYSVMCVAAAVLFCLPERGKHERRHR